MSNLKLNKTPDFWANTQYTFTRKCKQSVLFLYCIFSRPQNESNRSFDSFNMFTA